MKRLLLLYDMDDRDFARDISDLLAALDVKSDLIPRAPDGGTTLQDKEATFFEAVDAALFLITPGSERHGRAYPSPSVADEMGQAKQRFKDEPWRVIYLVDSECSIQAVDQRAYISYVRSDHRSVVEAVRRMILALKDAGLLAVQLATAPEREAEVDVAALVDSMARDQRSLLMKLARATGGSMFYHDFIRQAGDALLDQARGNLLVRDLLGLRVVAFSPGLQGVGGTASVYVTNAGWELVRIWIARDRAEQAKNVAVPNLGLRPLSPEFRGVVVPPPPDRA